MSLDRREFLQASAGVIFAGHLQLRPYALTESATGRVLTSGDGRVAFEYVTSRPAGSGLTAESACFFHPVHTPAGERLTDLAPDDHTTHRGIFFAWLALEADGQPPVRGDFWGWGRFAPTAGRVIGNRDVRLVRADTRSATVEIENDWTIDGRRCLAERTTARWQETSGANVLDLVYRFTPDVDVTLDQRAFSGFCLRARKDGRSSYVNPDGPVTLPEPQATDPTRNWPAAAWYAYSIALTNGRTIGGAVIDHPSNPRATWHNPRAVHMLQPTILGGGPTRLPRGEMLTLAYRAVAFDGDVPTDLLNRLASEWRAITW